jgi:hypothetical protein
MGIASKFSGLRRGHALCLIGATALLIPGFLWGGDLLAGAQPSTSGAGLAQQYLSALGPAGTAISTAEAKLKALAITATVAQVKAVVAPLPKALGPLETLTQGGGSSPTGPSLQSLGKPTIEGTSDAACHAYSTPASGGHLIVEGIEYEDGFQISTSCTGGGEYGDYTWEIGTKYTSLKVQVGYDLSNSSLGSTIRFLGNHGEYLPFVSNGRIVEAMRLPAKGLASVSVNLTQQSQLTVRIIYDSFCDAGTCAASAIDLVNDTLS